jgi:hypothetical protein
MYIKGKIARGGKTVERFVAERVNSQKTQFVADRLIDLCSKRAEQVAEQWYRSLMKNQKTAFFHGVSQDTCLHHATIFYRNLGKMYFGDDVNRSIADVLDMTGIVEYHYVKGTPLEDLLYALILLRREIWLYAELQALFNNADEMYQAVQSINRLLVIFDHVTFIVTAKYGELNRKRRMHQ